MLTFNLKAKDMARDKWFFGHAIEPRFNPDMGLPDYFLVNYDKDTKILIDEDTLCTQVPEIFCNDKEIYTGDFVLAFGNLWVVVYEGETASFCLRHWQNNNTTSLSKSRQHMVVGNIHDPVFRAEKNDDSKRLVFSSQLRVFGKPESLSFVVGEHEAKLETLSVFWKNTWLDLSPMTHIDSKYILFTDDMDFYIHAVDPVDQNELGV